MDIGTLVTSLVSLIIGAVLTLGATSWHAKQRAKQELRSLILAFCTEFVWAFGRCVAFQERLSEDPPSFSLAGLFKFTDAGMFSRLSSVCEDPEVARAVITLKNDYYQIGRHLDVASEIFSRAKSNPEITDASKMKAFAIAEGYQRIALSFFDDYLERIDLETKRVIRATKKYAPSNSANGLEKLFNKRWQNYKNVIDSDQARDEGAARVEDA